MINAQNRRLLNVTPPAAIVDNASLTCAEVDTVVLGVKYMYATFFLILGALDISVAAFKIQESDTTGQGFTDITGCVYGATGAPTLPSSTDDNKIYGIGIDLRGRKRFLQAVVTCGDGSSGTYACVLCELSRANEAPDDNADRGLGAFLLK